MRRLLVTIVVVLGPLGAAAAASAAGPGPLPGTWGGTITASTGEAVTIDITTAVPEDPALQQKWADFLVTLKHGPEISTVTVVLTTQRAIQFQCGRGALACYFGNSLTLYTPLDDVPGEATAQSILAHEYGHHVAQNSDNSPWPAEDWGTKRWATAMNVCAGVRAGQLKPGDEGSSYLYNPGEAFAESYRLLNEQLLSLPISEWGVVSGSLYPSQTALDALAQDIATPWTGPHLETRTSSFAKTSKVTKRTFTFATPLDGTLAVSIKGARTGAYRLSYNGTICGNRTSTVTVTRVKGYGAFTLTASIP